MKMSTLVGLILSLFFSSLASAALTKSQLGEQLFFDVNLSEPAGQSCASCHDPSFGYGKDTQFGVGVKDQTGNRNGHRRC